MLLFYKLFRTNYFTSLFIGPLEALKGLNFMRVVNIHCNDDYNYVYFKATNLFVVCYFDSFNYFSTISNYWKKFHSSIRSNIKDGKFAELKKFKKDKIF